MKKVFIGLIIFSIPCFGFCQNKLQTKVLFGGKIILSLPKGLNATEKVADEKADYLFVNKRSTAALMITATDQTVSDNDIPAFADSVINEIKKTESFIDDGISLNDGKNISYIKYKSESGKGKGFNYLFFGSMNEKLVLFSFNCPARQRNSWEKDIDELVAALRIKD